MSHAHAKHAKVGMPSTHSPMGVTPIATAELGERLAQLVQDMTITQQRIATAIAQQRDAMRQARPDLLSLALAQHQEATRHVLALDQARRELVARVVASNPALRTLRSEKITLSLLAQHADAGTRAHLLERIGALRALVAQVQRDAQGVGAAARDLSAHMEGLMRRVSQQLSHAGTYSKRGVVECAGGAVVSAVDLRS